MTEIVGGLRKRLVRDSLHSMIEESMTALGWFDPGRRHETIRLLGRPLRWDEPVVPNLLAITIPDESQEESEMGNTSHTVSELNARIELYAQSESLGVELSSDLMGVLNGQIPSIGRERASFALYDFRDATPPVIGYVKIDDVERFRDSSRFDRVWMRGWFIIAAKLTDFYGTDD
jgi:hypothetical protein